MSSPSLFINIYAKTENHEIGWVRLRFWRKSIIICKRSQVIERCFGENHAVPIFTICYVFYSFISYILVLSAQIPLGTAITCGIWVLRMSGLQVHIYIVWHYACNLLCGQST